MSTPASSRDYVDPHPAVSTPWGPSQSAFRYGDGVIFHSTSSHGGFKLDALRNSAMPPALRLFSGWYEEDGDWARVATGFPELFTDEEKVMAERILRDWMPDAWESIYGHPLAPDQSFTRDREHFQRVNATNWVVISASRSTKYAGEIEALASIGGARDRGERRTFLVPSASYAPGRHGFVIDPQRHPRID